MSRTGPARTVQALPIITLALRNEADVVLVRQRARLIAELLGFSHVDQTRVATAVSEIARNAVQHGGGGRVRCALSGDLPRRLLISIEDSGAGITAVQTGAAGRGRGVAGVGVELSRRLMDRFESHPREQGGTVVQMSKRLPPPRQAMAANDVRALVDELLRRPPESLIEELHHQHQELLAVLENLTTQQESLRQVNAELEETNRGVMALYTQIAQELDDTNRGVMALYAQLDDQARELQRVNSLKDQFISHLSHEFRTPLNSALALSRLLLDEADGPLSNEQERQVRFIHDGAGELLGMVNDLLDLAKIEAGRLDVNPETFLVEDLFSALRGMLRPLAMEKGLELAFTDPPEEIPALWTDQHKTSQVLRNLIANAIKFTQEGGVRIGARLEDAETLVFEVEDTGIGIPPDQIERIFEEFEQVASVHQRGTPGTGLGLPLARKLAALLGGSIWAESRPGGGSTFRFRLPARLFIERERVRAPLPREAAASVASGIDLGRTAPAGRGDATGPLVLVVDDDPASRYLVEHTLAPSGCVVAHASSGREALQRARELQPSAIFLDLGLPDMSGLDVLHQLKADPQLGDRPIIIYTSRQLPAEERHLLTGFALRVVTKDDPDLGVALGNLGAALVRATEQRPLEE